MFQQITRDSFYDLNSRRLLSKSRFTFTMLLRPSNRLSVSSASRFVRSLVTWRHVPNTWRRVSNPEFPEEQFEPYFSIGAKFDLSSDGIIAVNKIREKFAARYGQSFQRLDSITIFSKIPILFLKFCEGTLTEVSAEHSNIIMELGSPFVLSRPQTHISYAPDVRWELSKIDELDNVGRQLAVKFSPLTWMKWKKSLLLDHTPGKRYYLQTEEDASTSIHVLRASLRLFTSPRLSLQDAREALGYIESEYENRSLSVKVLGLQLWSVPMKGVPDNPHWVQKYLDYPFRGTQ